MTDDEILANQWRHRETKVVVEVTHIGDGVVFYISVGLRIIGKCTREVFLGAYERFGVTRKEEKDTV